MRHFRNVVHTLAGLALVAAAGCDDSTSPPPATVTRAEARAIASAVFTDLTRAVGSQTPTSRDVSTPVAVGPTVTGNINGNCSNGGSIGGTISLTSNLNGNGSGNVNGEVSVAAANCNIDTGQRIVSVTGGYNFAFNVGLSNNQQSSDFVWVATGTLTWTGGSCTLDYTVRIARNGTRSVTGTVCGADVRGGLV